MHETAEKALPPPEPGQLVNLASDNRPILTVVVDTEEEFDWSRPHDRENTAVTAMDDIYRFQDLFDQARVKPCYVIDFPVASQEMGYRALKEFHEQGRCTIGAHVHPWVNPPFEEEVNARNSYPGNLPLALEREKLSVLNRQIESVFGRRAMAYKAGRYGVGPNTGRILEELGFEIDLSALPAFDFSADGGPNFEEFPNQPWWIGGARNVLCIPNTGALVGPMGKRAIPCYRLASSPGFQALRVPGILARLRLVDRLRLSPEGYTFGELKRLTRFLYKKGLRIFSMSFHSPSARPGCTPYVRTKENLAQLLSVLRSYFEFFSTEMNGEAMSPEDMRRYLLSKARPQE